MAGLVTLLMAALLPACGDKPVGGPEPVQAPVRNVLLLVVDTLRADRLGCYGYGRNTTPNIDQLAARGTLYENCHAQGSNTRYSMISMMSGLYVSDEEERLPSEYTVLAERIQASGRATAAFVGNNGLASGTRGFERGFDHFDLPGTDPNGHEAGRSKQALQQFTNWYASNEAALRSGKGFFAWVHVMDTHKPYTAPQSYREKLKGPLPEAQRLRAIWDDPAALGLLEAEIAKDAAKDVTSMLVANNDYDAQVVRLDESVGELLDFLRDRGELDDTLVIFAADHGEIVFDRVKYPEEVRLWSRTAKPERRTLKEMYFYDHGVSFHEELWKTPLILCGPGMPAGMRRKGLTANLDIYPTVLQAFGLSASEGLRGRSLLGGVDSNHDRVFAYTIFTDAVLEADGWKLVDRRKRVQTLHDPKDIGPETRSGAIELFDLNTDPFEATNVASKHPERVAAMLKLIREWKLANDRARDTAPLDDSDMEALIQLGYLQEARQHGAELEDDDR